jgi:Protein of unknown function (DUF3606)
MVAIATSITWRRVISDDTINRGPDDRKRVNVHKDYEVRYWTGQFGCTPGQLESAVKAVGVMADCVALYLKRG